MSMNMTDMMQALSNPQGYVTNMCLQQLIREHPQEWQQCQQMFANKSRKQQVAELSKLYKSKGMDLNAVAKQYGIPL